MKSQPRIALVLSSMKIGGMQRVMLHLADGFIKKGYIVDFVVVKAKGPFLKMLPAEVNLVDLGAKRVLSAFPAMVHYLRKNKPDAILSGLTHINIAMVISRYLSGISTRLVVSEVSNFAQKKIYNTKIWDRFINELVNLFYPFADAIVAVSKDAADDLVKSTKLDPKSVTAIYNPVAVDEIIKLSKKEIAQPVEFNLNPFILAVGRLSRPKDYPTLIKAFNIIRSKTPIQLIIIGEGEGKLEIEELVAASPYSEDIRLFGETNNPFPFMAKADVFVLSSAWEGFGMVLVEALACGATVVSTDCHSGPSEILDNGKYGRLVPVGDPQSLADAIEFSLKHPFPKKQSIARAKEFSVERAVSEYLKILFPEKYNQP